MLDLMPAGSGVKNIELLPAVFGNMLFALGQPGAAALFIGLMMIAILMVWPKIARGKLGLMPAPLVAVITVSFIAYAGSFGVNFVSILENFFASLGDTALPFKAMASNTEAWIFAIELALIASA